MKKQTKKTLWRGLTSTSAVLMVVSLFGTQCAITYTGTLNSYLGHNDQSYRIHRGPLGRGYKLLHQRVR